MEIKQPTPNQPVAGKAGIGPQSAIEHHCPGLSEPDRSTAKPMKPSRFILMLAACILLGAIASGTITMVSWGARIEDKAFHCWDIGLGSYWTDIDSHASACDAISSGWTWEQLKAVRLHYLEAFWLLWAVIAFIVFWIIHKLRPTA